MLNGACKWSGVRCAGLGLAVAAAGLLSVPVFAQDAKASDAHGGLKANSGRAATLDYLQYMPKDAQVALALPAFNDIMKKIVPLAKRLFDEGEVDIHVGRMVHELGSGAGVPDAKSFDDIAVAKGVNINAPIAVFADFRGTVDSAGAASAKADAKGADSAKPGDAAKSGDGAAKSGDGAKSGKGKGGKGSSSDSGARAKDLKPPAFVAVMSVLDAGKAEATLKDLLAQDRRLDGKSAQDVKAGNITIHSYDPKVANYFIAGDKLLLGNDLDLLKEAAERAGDPAKFRYGTADAPVQTADEAVALIYGNRFLPLLQKALPSFKMDEAMRTFVNAQVASMAAMMGDEQNEDPILATLGWTPDKAELAIRMDTKTHPDIVKISGVAKPLRLAQVLPDNTLALLSLRFNEEWKKQVTDVYMKAIPDKMQQDAGFAQGLTMANQALQMLGDEATLGVTGVDGDFPQLFLMVGLANPEPTKGLLQMLIPMMPGETYQEVPINTIAAPIPVPLSIAFPGDVMLVSNNVDGMKKIIENLKNNKTTNLFSSMKPALDPKTPRYNLLVLNTKMLSDVVLPLSSLTHGLPPEAQGIMKKVSEVLNEARLSNEMDGTWQATKLSLYLKPEGAKGDAGAKPAATDGATKPASSTL